MAGRQGKYVRVLYDYKYDSHGKNITIKEGDKCLLLKKTNSEWWSVIKHGEKKPIYVPANYVVELDDGKRSKVKGLRRHGGSVEDVAEDEKSRSSSEDLLQNDDAFQNGSGSCDTSEHDSDSIRAKMTASDDSLDRIVDVDPEMEALEGAGVGSRVKNMVDKYEAPEYANLETIRQASKKPPKLQEAEPEYANITNIQAALRGPPPTPDKAAEPIRQFAHDWEMYMDKETGRSYYHNTVSGENTWKPPRGLRAKDSSSPVPLKPPAPAVPEKPPPSPGRGRLKSFNSFGTAVVLGSTSDGDEDVPTEYIQVKGQSLPRLQKLPKGWSEEKTEDGVTTYHNSLTNEKYLSSVDDNGRVYYYKEDQSESTWVLPEIEQPPSTSTHHLRHQGRHERRNSVDSAIPEGVAATNFKPRHSTILQHHIGAAAAAGDGLAEAFGNYPPAYRHSIAASPSALLGEEKKEDLRSPKLKQVDLPSVPDLPMSPKSPFSDLSSGPVSPEVLESPISPTFSTSTPSESPCGSLKRHGQGEQRGMLNRTKVTEGGKKVKKNWCPSYVIVQGFTLYFYKDHKAAQPKPGSPSGRPDEVLDLHGATHELNNKEKTSRKNSIVITLLSGTQWLLQSEDSQKIQSWYGTLAHNLAQMPQMVVSRGSQESLNQSSDSLEQLEDDNSPPNASRMNRKKSRKEPKDKDKGATQLTDKEKTNTLDDPNLTLPEKQTKIKARLRNFFGQRPEKKTLQAKGIIKETVFGANLQHLADREKTPVPMFIQQVAHTIEEKGLSVDGIYRVSGNLSQIMKLRHMVDHNEKYDFENPDWDVHVLTGALKLFFRELMEPLFPFKQFNMLLGGIKLHDRSGKLKAFKDAIKSLPRPHRETIKFLFKHLNKVIEHSKENRMQTQNVAIVFGPTLMWPETETQNVAVTTVYQSQIVEFILLEYRNLF